MGLIWTGNDSDEMSLRDSVIWTAAFAVATAVGLWLGRLLCRLLDMVIVTCMKNSGGI